MQDQKIHIAASTIVKTVLILLGFYLLYVLRDIALLIITSVVIAAAVEPATRWFTNHKIPRVPAVIVVYLVGLSALGGIVYFFVPAFVSEFLNFARSLPEYTRELQMLTGGAESGILNQLTQNLSTSELLSQVRELASRTTGGVLQALSAIFGGVLSLLLVLVISFYLAAQQDGVKHFLQLVTPPSSQTYVLNLWARAQEKIGLWLQGQLLLGFIVGALVYVGLWLLGVPNALLLAVIAGVFELIPVFGPIISAVPAVLVAFTVSPTLGFLTIGLYVLVQQFENYLIQPMVVQKVVGISPLVAILALIIGGKLAGFLGVILSVPIAAVIMEFLGDLSKERDLELQENEQRAGGGQNKKQKT